MFPSRDFFAYGLGGQLVLWASRHWMCAERHGTMIAPCAWQSFAHADLTRAYALLCELLTIVSHREFPARGFANVCAQELTDDERRFMALLVAVEDGDSAYAAVQAGTSPAVYRAVLQCGHCLVQALHNAGHCVRPSSTLAGLSQDRFPAGDVELALH